VVRVVLDANVYVSATLRPEGPPGQIIERFLRIGDFEIVLSPAIVQEVLGAFAYPKVRRFMREGSDPELWFEDILILADLVAGERAIEGACSDPDDDKYLAAALEGRATWVVTGDRRLLAVTEYEGVRVVNPRVFLGFVSEPGL
jgi:putative PIN family toxin of toxin-antitoxin system